MKNFVTSFMVALGLGMVTWTGGAGWGGLFGFILFGIGLDFRYKRELQ